MLVFGDRVRGALPAQMLDDIERSVLSARASSGTAQVDLLTRALVAAGELAQGAADAEFEGSGVDDLTPAGGATMDLAVAVAGLLLGALKQPAAQGTDFDEALEAARRLPSPSPLQCKTPEGYAFYAIFPESYAKAAAAAELSGSALVIGLRSIGTSLAAAVAARLGCPAMTVRPVGHPFSRELRLSERMRARLAAHSGAFLVVDEGPGLSGSSFGAVADFLEGLGVALERIVFVPSHGAELGSIARPAHRARWAHAQRSMAEPVASGPVVAAWFDDEIGSSEQEELSGGAWRRDVPQGAWPPAAPVGERLKFRLAGVGVGGRYVARFAGLGASGKEKLEAARRLHRAGFTPEPLALRRGFLLERWVEGERLAASAGRDLSFLDHLARYLGHRASALPPPASGGASFGELRTMASRNAAELGGPVLSNAVERELTEIGEPENLAPVWVDGKLHAWEWLRLSDRRFCKTDALDHAVAHDLVGCQDLAWDVAGAAVEFELDAGAAEDLRLAVAEAAGRRIGRDAVAAFRICYAAFQAGYWSMNGEGGPDGAARTAAQIARYQAALRSASGIGRTPEPVPEPTAAAMVR